MSVTWNPSDKSSLITLSYGNLRTTHTGSNSWGGVRATSSKIAGKWYWEVEVNIDKPSTGIRIGIGTSSADLSKGVGDDVNGYGYGGHDGKKYHDDVGVAYGNSYTTGDIIGIALDLNAGKIWWAKNNVWQASGDPAAGTNEAYNSISGTFFPMQSTAVYEDVLTAKFNIIDQTYSPPSGFSAICPDIGLILTSPLSATVGLDNNFQIDFSDTEPLTAVTEIQFSEVRLGDIIAAPLIADAALLGLPCIDIICPPFVATEILAATHQIDIIPSSLTADAELSCDHCFNYARIDSYCPTPTCEAMAVFRYARIDASPPVPTASFRIGKIIEGDCPVPEFTCIAYSGRDPSIIASAPCPTCSMRIGLSFSGDVPIPTCNVVADTHHLATIYGRVPVPLITCIGDTENITVISGTVPTPTGLFEVTVGNVASIFGRSPCPYCTMTALTGQVVTLFGRVPVPGALVRFYASLANDTIILTGTVPTPTMTSSVDCFTSSILRHVRGKIR